LLASASALASAASVFICCVGVVGALSAEFAIATTPTATNTIAKVTTIAILSMLAIIDQFLDG